MLKLNPDSLRRMLFPSFKSLHVPHRLWLHFVTLMLGFLRLVEIGLLLIFFSSSEVIVGWLLFLFCQLFYSFEQEQLLHHIS